MPYRLRSAIVALVLTATPLAGFAEEIPARLAAAGITNLKTDLNTEITAADIPGAAPTVPDGQVLEASGLSDDSTPVYGQWLFQGDFGAEQVTGFNPGYTLSIGDTIVLRLWGAFEAELPLVVDAQGNVFVPKVGPIAVAGVRNEDLNSVFTNHIKDVFRDDVGVYASLAQAQPVKVFVAGHVERPGLYSAFASDSILHFLDRAGGIDPESGSYLDITVLREGRVTKAINLYDFLDSGKLELVQFQDGDTIFVGQRQSVAKVSGLVGKPAQYEFEGAIELETLLERAGVSRHATNVEIARNSGEKRSAMYLSLHDDISDVYVLPSDEIVVVADRLVKHILVTVEGEHKSKSQYVMPYSSTLAQVMDKVELSEQSSAIGLQLFRKSIAERQKQLLNESIDRLEASILNARSASKNEAGLRTAEAALISKFIARAREIDPKGQLILQGPSDWESIALEDGDVIRIPRHQHHVNVHGEVFFPNAFSWNPEASIRDYIKQAGGYTTNANARKVLVRTPSGALRFEGKPGLFGKGAKGLLAGDEILVLPKVDSKRFQFSSDIVQILYQTAVAAGVVLAL